MSIVRQRRENSKHDDQIVIVDDIIDILSSLLEFSGIISNKNDNNNNNNNNNNNSNNSNNGNNKKDPWDQLSSSIKELIISLGKLHKLVSDDNDTITISITSTNTNANDTTVRSFETTNELILFIENMIHQVRVDAKSLSTILPKITSSQLKLCRRLESIIRRNNNSNTNTSNNNNKRWLSTLTLLLPMAKSLAGAVRQQKAMCLESLQIIGKCLDEELYSQEDTTEIIDNLQIMYKKFHRRCLDHDRSPWKEAVRLLEYIASNEIQILQVPSSRDDKPDIITRVGTSDSDTTNCQDAIFVNLPHQKICSILPLPSSSSSSSSCVEVNSNCASSQLQNMVEDLLYETTTLNNNDEGKRVLSILVFGPEGSGKTFLLNEIENYCSRMSVAGGGADVDVIHPVLPFDAIGTTVGAAEEIIISLICYAKTKEGRCVLLLDDIDSIFGQTELTTTNEPHQTSRLRQLFFSLLEIIQERNYDARNGRMILICSSKDNFGNKIDRFDKILPMLPPNEEQRKGIISNYHIGEEHDEAQHIGRSDISVANLVECTIGLSRAELSHYCREALMSLQSRQESGADTNDFLSFLKQKLQSATPESLKQGVNDDFVDMKVFSARDLQKLYPIRNPENPIADLPLFGESAKAAWRELRRLIVMPVCQGPALDKIMYHRGGRTEKKAFVGGVLLAAAPGTGKSTISYFCAAFASSINHSVKLIDVSCTSLIHKEVGGSERALHRLFRSARSATPCIIVMDGIENIAAVRGNDNTTEGTMDRVLSTLLTELDGVESDVSIDNTPGCMTVIGITHNPLWIDPALRRPGRLERTIWLDSPDLEGRKQIVLKELGDVIFKPDQIYPGLQKLDDLANQLALETDGYTGAGIIAICNESKLLAFNNFFKDDGGEKRDYITPQVVFEAANSKRPDGR
ncbi:MAG: SpoVK/Ycf46/Vps4 family AAA+-type ATPase [Bacillariaceae sp.]|jgi:SpoVK/Ycf46/Vps4 family AAA+-type ATPase